jgi:hypothetical protein
MGATQRTLTLKSIIKRKRLTWHRDHDPKLYVRERCAAMLKIADGHSPHWVALHGLLKPRGRRRVSLAGCLRGGRL